ncbi:MAG: hypothetical protein P4M09_16785 [Devosia sp.]|nr:hypothetical protein [Devosia sp.]
MAGPLFYDRVQESSTTTGTGSYTLLGANTGFQPWSVVGNGNTGYYVATDGTNWEAGIGTYTASGTTLARTTILASSNANAAVSWGAGTRTISLVTLAAFLNGLLSKSNNLSDVASVAAARANLSVSPSGFRNRLINGNGNINQRVATAPTNDTYGWDRHNLLTQTAAIGISTLSNVQNGLPSMMRMTQSQATAQRMGNTQIIESVNCVDLRGQTVTLLGKLRNSLNAAVRYAILEWTGTADAVISDVVNSWTNGTFTAGQFFKSTTTNVLAVGAITPTAATVTDFLLTATVGNSANNLIVMIWTETAQAQSSTLDAAWELLDYDATGKTYPTETRAVGVELEMCQRCYAHSFQPGTAPAQGLAGFSWMAGFAWNASNIGTHAVFFPVPMRVAPTLTLYKPSNITGTPGNWQWYNNGSFTYVDTTTSVQTLSEKCFCVTMSTTGATTAGGYIVQGNWAASAEL